MSDLGRGTHIGWHADSTGYGVTVYDCNADIVTQYHAGNHPYDSAAFVQAGGLPLQTLRKYARQTAGEFALEYGVAPVMIMEECSS
jgi:hypothetical protein